MNSKKAGWAFFSLVMMHCTLVFALALYHMVFPDAEGIGIVANLIISEVLVVTPILLIALTGKRREKLSEIHGFRKIRISTVFLTVLFTILVMPLATLFNAISMLFVENTITAMVGDIMDVPFLLLFFLMAVFGPFCEELAFRGILWKWFRSSQNTIGAILLSALLFGLMHMNINQALYAFALGVMLALLAEATGSTTAPFICHMVFNGHTVCMLAVEKLIYSEEMLEEMNNTGYAGEELLATIMLLSVVAVIGTGLALLVLGAIARREGNPHFFRKLWSQRKQPKTALITVPLWVGMMGALLYMVIQEILI